MSGRKNKIEGLKAIAEFLSDSNIDDEWWENHAEIELDENGRTLSINIDKMNHQEMQWIREAMNKLRSEEGGDGPE